MTSFTNGVYSYFVENYGTDSASIIPIELQTFQGCTGCSIGYQGCTNDSTFSAMSNINYQRTRFFMYRYNSLL